MIKYLTSYQDCAENSQQVTSNETQIGTRIRRYHRTIHIRTRIKDHTARSGSYRDGETIFGDRTGVRYFSRVGRARRADRHGTGVSYTAR